jgi:hypothetical protein
VIVYVWNRKCHIATAINTEFSWLPNLRLSINAQPTFSPWRWQLLCLSKHRITLNIEAAHSLKPKFYIQRQLFYCFFLVRFPGRRLFRISPDSPRIKVIAHPGFKGSLGTTEVTLHCCARFGALPLCWSWRCGGKRKAHLWVEAWQPAGTSRSGLPLADKSLPYNTLPYPSPCLQNCNGVHYSEWLICECRMLSELFAGFG